MNALHQELRKMCVEDFEAYQIYKYLGRYLLSNERVKKVFKDASHDELRHHLILTEIIGGCSSKISKFRVLLYLFIALLFGTTITLKLMESAESSAIRSYRTLVKVDEGLSSRIMELMRDEEVHERNFVNSLDEKRIKYLGSITLGISDALVELIGVYAGALGAFSSTSNAGLVGMLAGVSATLSMSIASYNQAKQEVGKSPKLSALYTGLAYFAVVLALASPYFLTTSIFTGFFSMLIIAIGIIAYISFYTSVLYSRSYLREFAEGAALLLGVSLLLYFMGELLDVAIT